MTNISKKKLDHGVEAKLFKQMAQMFAEADKKNTEFLFSELFSETEKIMFMKRLAIILMLHKRQSTYRIAKLLNVSDATVRRIAQDYQAGRYDHILGVATKPSFNVEKFWKTMEVLLRAGMPAYGKDRWKGFGFDD